MGINRNGNEVMSAVGKTTKCHVQAVSMKDKQR